MAKIKSDPAKTVLTICTGLVVIGLVKHQEVWFFRIAALLGILAIASDLISKQIEWAWHKLAFILGKIVPNVILTIVFWGCIFPLSLLRRLFSGKDLLKLKNNQSSTYVSTPKSFERVKFEQQW